MPKLNVLVVHQDQSVEQLIERMLSSEDCHVKTVRSPALAFEIVLKQDIHVVITNLKSLSSELKHFLRIPPLIVLFNEFVESPPHGADLFLQTPYFKMESLPTVIENLVESRRQRLAS